MSGETDRRRLEFKRKPNLTEPRRNVAWGRKVLKKDFKSKQENKFRIIIKVTESKLPLDIQKFTNFLYWCKSKIIRLKHALKYSFSLINLYMQFAKLHYNPINSWIIILFISTAPANTHKTRNVTLQSNLQIETTVSNLAKLVPPSV